MALSLPTRASVRAVNVDLDAAHPDRPFQRRDRDSIASTIARAIVIRSRASEGRT